MCSYVKVHKVVISWNHSVSADRGVSKECFEFFFLMLTLPLLLHRVELRNQFV